MKNSTFWDAEHIRAAVEKARNHADERGKPLNLARVALYLGITSHDMTAIISDFEQRAKRGDENAAEIVRAFKMAHQEVRADLEDCLAGDGNKGGYIFLGKVNHKMVETTAHEVTMKGVSFIGGDDIPD